MYSSFANTVCHLYFAAFTSIHLIATGVSCFLGAGLLSFLIYVYCQRFHKPSQESAIIHPTTPNHLNYKGNTTPKNEKYTPMEFKVSEAHNIMQKYKWKCCLLGVIQIHKHAHNVNIKDSRAVGVIHVLELLFIHLSQWCSTRRRWITVNFSSFSLLYGVCMALLPAPSPYEWGSLAF